MATTINNADHPFNTVYNVAELTDLIMDLLGQPALVALSYTSKLQYFRVQDYLRLKLTKIFAPFRLTRDDLLITLLSAHAFIIGSAALKAIAPAVMPITSDNLDIVVPLSKRFTLEAWLTSKLHGYKRTTPIHTNCIPFVMGDSFSHVVDGQIVTVNLLIVSDLSQGHELIFYSSNTASMNMITHSSIFTGYPTLLNLRIAAQNCSINMIGMGGAILSQSTKVHQIQIDSENNAKARQRGFTILPYDTSHWNEYATCECVHLSACPLTIRNMNDTMCSWIPLLTDQEYADKRIKGPHQRVPPVVWRLADDRGRVPGFSFCLTNERLMGMQGTS
jgi:hypothetical protein